MEELQMMFNLSVNNESDVLNATEMKNRVYVFTPAGFTTKLALVFVFASVGTVGLVGNVLIYYFMSFKRKVVSYMQYNPFLRNFNSYIKSLALSDIMSNMISLPLICIQIMVDVFQHDWACRIVRFIGILLPSITMNNLMVISVERYLATRAVPRSFSVSSVRKLVFTAWLAGFIVVLGPTATFKGIRCDLNDTHYTVVCKYDNSYLPFRIIAVCYALVQHLIPCVILSYLNISVAKTLRPEQKKRIDIQRNNAIRANLIKIIMEGSQMMSNFSVSNESALLNATEKKPAVYVFTPTGFTTKLALLLVFASVGATLWTRQRKRIDIQRNNAIRANLIATKLRGTYLLIAMTFAFIIPYSALLYYAVYVMLAKRSLDFKTDFITRYLSVGLLYSNGAINFIIYMVQMTDFRAFLKKLFCGNGNPINPDPPGDGIQLRALIIPNNP
ncbi:uncharacterized protein LOC110061986 [Orbicella faveolata]|uniref:uncharacterized protein LOC110061986 n=1 Tax=Orbicella faveolata TaxID=48498 RepID=UPI0009E192C6|nr:uncharacterized protein LOC110061986 [Orbicella faveolata]